MPTLPLPAWGGCKHSWAKRHPLCKILASTKICLSDSGSQVSPEANKTGRVAVVRLSSLAPPPSTGVDFPLL